MSAYSAPIGWSDVGERAAIGMVAGEARGQPVLDVGVGAGRTTGLLGLLTDDYIGIDSSSPMIEAARRRFPAADLRIADVRDLSALPRRHFALAVFSFNGIDTLPHDARGTALSQLHAALRPGGRLVFSTHNRLGPAHGQRPWRTASPGLRGAAEQLRRLRQVGSELHGYRRWLRNSGLIVDHGDWSIDIPRAHAFGLVAHYTTLPRQLAELVAVGFDDAVALAREDGRRVGPDADTTSVAWFHVVARRPR